MIKMNYEEINRLEKRVNKFIEDGGDCKNISYLLGGISDKISEISELEKDINEDIDIINRIMRDSKAKTLVEASATLRKELVENYNYPNKDDIEIKKCCDCHNHLKYGSNDYNAGYHLDTNDCYEEYEDEEDPLVYF